MLPLNFARLEFKVYDLEFKVCKGQSFLNWLYTCIQVLSGRGPPSLGPPDKNEHKIFASTLGKLVRALVIEGQKICNGPPPKEEFGKIRTLFLVDMIAKKVLRIHLYMS
jgi:hypothetical protein